MQHKQAHEKKNGGSTNAPAASLGQLVTAAVLASCTGFMHALVPRLLQNGALPRVSGKKAKSHDFPEMALWATSLDRACRTPRTACAGALAPMGNRPWFNFAIWINVGSTWPSSLNGKHGPHAGLGRGQPSRNSEQRELADASALSLLTTPDALQVLKCLKVMQPHCRPRPS